MLIGWLYTPSGCMAPGQPGGCTRGVSAERFETPLAGGAAWFWRRGGNPPRPGLPPEGETEKGESKFLIPWCRRPALQREGDLQGEASASPYSHSKVGIPNNIPVCGSAC